MQKVTRLIEQFIPKNYNLSIKLNREERTFTGLLVLIGNSVDNKNSVKLHSKELNIKSVAVNGKSAEFSLSRDDDELVISLNEINQDEYIIVIDYSGVISDSMHGLYPCYYEHDGQKKELLATQFESHHAREVLPCIDEPEAKAVFDVTLETELNVTVLGNMPIKSQDEEEGKLITTFDSTPVMSSYLLAWVVGELHKKTAYTKNGVEVNVWATPAQQSDNLDFALDIATRSIDFFDEYFDTRYPLTKCDHVALPDFSSGAMENWGLITYREMALLADPKTTSVASKHYVATVIAHELSHQWFGNLVTMKWWNDLWLNESFASLVEYSAIDSLEPEWNVWLDFASYESIAALRRDSLDGVQSVQTEVNHPDEIGTLFDGAIVYAKGARLMKMLQNYIGEKAFQNGLKNYFKDYAYKNTEAKDLWNAFKNSCGKDVESLMSFWIRQPGYPVLNVQKNGNKIKLSQQRLVSFGNEEPETVWPITLNSNYSEFPEIFNDRVIELEINLDDKKPLRFNVGNNAHFITHYDGELMSKIIEELKNGELSIIDRLQILNEQTLLARAGIINSSELLPLIEAFRDETAESVWDIIAMAIDELKKFVENDDEAELKLKRFVNFIAIKQFNKLGWNPQPGEPETITKMRSTIISLMLYSEDSEALKCSLDLFDINNLENTTPELRGLIIANKVKYSNDKSLIMSLFDKYTNTPSVEIKQDINLGLTATRDIEIIKLILDKVKDTTVIRTQDTARWIAYLSRNKFARQETWQWVQDNWEWIKDNFGGDKSYDDYPRYIASALMSRKQLDEYKSFFNPMSSDPALARVIKMGINEITDRIELVERDIESVQKAILDL